jgi:hypothetical protein
MILPLRPAGVGGPPGLPPRPGGPPDNLTPVIEAPRRGGSCGGHRVGAQGIRSVQLGDFHVTETVAEALIAPRDGNADGKLSWDEFWAGLNKA